MPNTLGFDAYSSSTSATVHVIVADDRTPVTVAISNVPSTSMRGDDVSLHAVVTPNPGSGLVAFLWGGSNQMGSMLIAADGTANVNYPFSADATYSLTACFYGNLEFKEGCSDPVSQTVISTPTTTTLSITPGAILSGRVVHDQGRRLPDCRRRRRSPSGPASTSPRCGSGLIR